MKRISLSFALYLSAITLALSQSIGGGLTPPGGADTQCQYNNGGGFGGVTGCTSNGTKLTLVAPALGAATATSIHANGGGSKTDVDLGSAANVGWYFPGSNAVAFSAGGTSAFFFDFTGAVPQFTLPSTSLLAWCNTTAADCGAQDAYIGRGGANEIQLGFTTGTSAAIKLYPSASVGLNAAGALFTIKDSGGTGTGASGGYAFQVAAAGGSGSGANAFSNAVTIAGGTGLIALPKITTDNGHTTSSVCQDTTTHALYFGSGTIGVCLGTSSVRFKPYIVDLNIGLKQIAALRPIKYRLDAAHGDPNKTLYGFTAEQGGAVIPELMTTDNEGNPNTFDVVGVVPVLVKAIQELQAEVNRLKNQK